MSKLWFTGYMPRPGDSTSRRRIRIAVVGGGISGLSTAYFLSQRLTPDQAEILLLESSDRWGGLIVSESSGRYLLEGGPDSFITQKPEALALCERLGLGNRLIESHLSHRSAFVFWQGQLHPLPKGLFKGPPIHPSVLLTASLLSWKGRIRAMAEPLIPSGGLKDESVSDFVFRRLGREVLVKIFEPLLAGVYGGKASQLSVRSTFPNLYLAEKKTGSIVGFRNLLSKKTKEKENRFVTLRGGMVELTQRLLEDMGEGIQSRLGVEVSSVRDIDNGFQIGMTDSIEHVDFVVLATAAPESAKILQGRWPGVAQTLGQIPYASAIIVLLGYSQDVLGGRSGSGFLVPRSERKTLLACTWLSQKFTGRCPEGQALLRCFISAEQAEDWMFRRDAQLLDVIRLELKEMMGIEQKPALEKVYRWRKVLPQYTLGHHRRVDLMQKRLESIPGLYLVGNFIDGVGISDCIRHAGRVSEQLVASFFKLNPFCPPARLTRVGE